MAVMRSTGGIEAAFNSTRAQENAHSQRVLACDERAMISSHETAVGPPPILDAASPLP